MKTLSLTRPLIIMTVGLPGAGKTRLAVQFAEMFGSPLVSYDRVRYELFNEPTYSDDEWAILQRIADYQLHELLKTKKTIIVDGGTSMRADRMAIRQMAAKHGYGTLLIWVQTDPITCEARSTSSRMLKEDPWRIPMSREAFEKLNKRWQAPTMQEHYVVVSGKHTFGAQARTILKRLVPAEHKDVPQAEGASTSPKTIQISPRPPRSDQPPPSPPRRSVTIN